MKSISRLYLWGLALALWVASQGAAWACATCFGAADSPLTKGLNWGIGSLLVIVLIVLGGVASFFIYLMRRSASVSDSSLETGLTEATGKAQ